MKNTVNTLPRSPWMIVPTFILSTIVFMTTLTHWGKVDLEKNWTQIPLNKQQTVKSFHDQVAELQVDDFVEVTDKKTGNTLMFKVYKKFPSAVNSYTWAYIRPLVYNGNTYSQICLSGLPSSALANLERFDFRFVSRYHSS